MEAHCLRYNKKLECKLSSDGSSCDGSRIKLFVILEAAQFRHTVWLGSYNQSYNTLVDSRIPLAISNVALLSH